jgi:hypothetical protein
MATRRTTAERIADTRERIEQYENQMKLLLHKQKEKERKERTHRLCERGGIVEKLLPGLIRLTPEQFDVFLQKTLLTPYTKRVFDELAPPPAEQTDGTATAESGETQAAPKLAESAQGEATATAQTVGNGTGKAG